MSEKFDGWDGIERELFEAAGREFDRRRSEGIRLESDRIVSMIFDGMPAVDVEIAVRCLRKDVLAEFPGREELFDSIYSARFRRIWEQFRPDEGELRV
jgi:hypothetical protein